MTMEPQRTYSYSEKPLINNQDYMVAFSGRTQNFCIGLVDIVNSTKISANLHEREWCKYYVVFLNSMAKILKKFGAVPLKNGGDSILYYFPQPIDVKNKNGFIGCLECNLAMIEAHQLISELVELQGLPSLDYRISSDYGKVVIMEPNSLSPIDIIGPPVNMCAKINHSAPINGMVIGGDLYEMVKELPYYRYKQTSGFSIGLKYSYPTYSVTRKN